MTRILLDGTPLDTSHRHRGVGRYTANLLAAIPACAPEDDSVRVLRLEGSPDHGGPTLSRPFRSTGRDWLKAAASWTRLERAIERDRADVFLGLDPDVVPRPRGTRFVATVYDIIPLLFPDEYLPWSAQCGLPRLLHAVWNPRRLRQADHVVAISHEVARTLVERLGMPPEHVTVVQPGADHLAGAVEGPRETLPSGRPFILHVGAVDPRKNLRGTMAALSLLPRDLDVALAVAGRMTTAEERDLRETARKLGVDDRLETLGFVDDARLSRLYRGAVAFAFPSLAEGWGLPVLEAMAHGCPVVTSDRSSLPEAAGDAALLVDPTRPEAIADALERIASDEALRSELVAKGLRRVGVFTWRASAEAQLAVLRG